VWDEEEIGYDETDRAFEIIPADAVYTIISVNGEFDKVAGDGILVFEAVWVEDGVKYCTVNDTWTDEHFEKIGD
jgi:hypothetical protein